MAIENDPAVLPEVSGADMTVTDPQVTEDAGESTTVVEGADTSSDEVKPEVKPTGEEFDIEVSGDKPVAPKAETPEKVKERNREFARLRARATELERKLAEKEAAALPAVLDPGAKPTLENCGYDAADYEAKLDAWHEAKRRKENADAAAAQEAQKAAGERQQKQTSYLRSKEEIMTKLPDYEELELTVAGGLSQVQREVILHYAENPALVIAALGRNPERLQDFASTKDLGSLIAKTAKLEVRTELKSKTTTPPPEKPIRGTGSKTGAEDAHLKRLQEQADKTGDRTEVASYLRDKRRKAQQ